MVDRYLISVTFTCVVEADCLAEAMVMLTGLPQRAKHPQTDEEVLAMSSVKRLPDKEGKK